MMASVGVTTEHGRRVYTQSQSFMGMRTGVDELTKVPELETLLCMW